MTISSNSPDWVKESVFYQIFPERFANGDSSNDPPGVMPWGTPPTRDNFFGGDLQGILDHLPYLQDLGINALYLTPIFKASTNHKYDTCDYFSVDPAFGSNSLLRELVQAAHQRGMRIILDAVFNHCGDSFWTFEDLLHKGKASRYKDWFYTTDFPLLQDPPNYQTCGGVSYLPKLNLAHREVQEYFLKVATHWIQEYDIDGWRLDVPWKVPLEFWRQLREKVKQTKSDAYIVGEVWRDPGHWLAGDTCDGIMNYPLRDYILDYCVHDTMDAEDFDHFSTRLRELFGSTAPFQLNHLGSHDTPRLLTICNRRVDRMILAVAVSFTMVGAPMIYYGDEIGMEGENDPDCRRCMIWNERVWNYHLRNTYRLLIQTRQQHPALRVGAFERLWVLNGIYAYRRRCSEDEVIVIVNPRDGRHCLEIPTSRKSAAQIIWRDLFTGETFIEKEGIIFVEYMQPCKALILIQEGSDVGRFNE